MKLYKYISFNSQYGWKNFLSILINHQIWFSSIKSLNDPFEGIFRKTNLKTDLGKIIQIGDHIVLSLSQSNDDHLMWSHYAGSHNGVAIEFETEKCELLKTAQPISYQSRISSYMNTEVQILLKKSISWKYEREYRVLKEKSLCLGNYFGEHLSFNEQSIKGIYLGKNINSVLAHIIYKKTRSLKIPCYRFDSINNNFRMSFNLIKSEKDLSTIRKMDAINSIIQKFNLILEKP
jgi:Protein of unknown function (DUF2971)